MAWRDWLCASSRVSSSSKLQIFQDASHLWGLLYLPFYLLGHFPSLQHVQGCTSTGVVEGGCWPLKHSSLGFLFHFCLSLVFLNEIRSSISTPFCLLAILDHAIQSFLAGMSHSHKDAGIGSGTFPTPWALSAGIFAVLSPLLDQSRTCSTPACIPLCVWWFCAINYELCHDYMYTLWVYIFYNLKKNSSQYLVFLSVY